MQRISDSSPMSVCKQHILSLWGTKNTHLMGKCFSDLNVSPLIQPNAIKRDAENIKLHCGYHVNGDMAFCVPYRKWQCYDLVITRINLHCLNSLHFVLTRQKRLAEWKATQIKNCFGDVVEISGQDYIKEVNKAGEGIWVVLHLYKQGWEFC